MMSAKNILSPLNFCMKGMSEGAVTAATVMSSKSLAFLCDTVRDGHTIGQGSQPSESRRQGLLRVLPPQRLCIPINDLLLSHIIGDGEADDLQVGMNMYDQLLRRHGSEEECPDNLGMGEGKKDESDIAASASVL